MILHGIPTEFPPCYARNRRLKSEAATIKLEEVQQIKIMGKRDNRALAHKRQAVRKDRRLADSLFAPFKPEVNSWKPQVSNSKKY